MDLPRTRVRLLVLLSAGALLLPTAPPGRADAATLYITNGHSATISVIDTATRRVVNTIPNVGTRPNRVAFSRDGARAYVIDDEELVLFVIDTARQVLKKHGGRVPQSLEELTELPGVGRKVANCVLVYAFERPAIPVDTHVHRVSNRLGWVKTKSPDQTERALEPILPKRHWLEINEILVAHGKAVCRPGRPLCLQCPAERDCPKVGV